MDTLEKQYGLNPYKGDVGIEIEVEGRRLPTGDVSGWNITHDGSLRGESLEYVTSTPVPITDVDKRLGNLTNAFRKTEGRVNDSVRAGVHVHINVQDLNPLQISTLMTLWYVCENLLVDWCGPYRKGNHFCLRASDAEHIIGCVIDALNNYDFAYLTTDELRYSAMNLKPLTSYGSIEFRSMRTPTNFSRVGVWAKMLYSLKQASLTYDNPQEVISEFSMETALDFMKRVLDGFQEEFKNIDVERQLHDGMRNAQDVAYCTNWATFAAEWEAAAGRKKSLRERGRATRTGGFNLRDVGLAIGDDVNLRDFNPREYNFPITDGFITQVRGENNAARLARYRLMEHSYNHPLREFRNGSFVIEAVDTLYREESGRPFAAATLRGDL